MIGDELLLAPAAGEELTVKNAASRFVLAPQGLWPAEENVAGWIGKVMKVDGRYRPPQCSVKFEDGTFRFTLDELRAKFKPLS